MKAGLLPNTLSTPDKPVCPTPARWLGCCSPLIGEPRAWLWWWLGDFSPPALSGIGCLLQGLQVQRWELFSVVFAASEGVEVRCGVLAGKGRARARALAGGPVPVRSSGIPLLTRQSPLFHPGGIPLPRAARHRALRGGSLLAFLVFAPVPQGCV